MKRLIVFDLDGTLAASKQPLEKDVGIWLGKLLAKCRVAVISGGAWPQFEKQLLANMPKDAPLDRLSLLPTSGTRFLRYQGGKDGGKWTELYAENFSDEEKHTIIAALTEVFEKSKDKPKKHWGEIIEDRGSQITLSALGQEAPLAAKAKWDPDFTKRKKMQAKLAKKLPDFAIGMGGASSLDVTRPGVDKAYGIAKLHEELKIDIADMLFIGDALFEGGNDYPARRSGVDCIQIAGPSETVKVIETIIVCTGPDAT